MIGDRGVQVDSTRHLNRRGGTVRAACDGVKSARRWRVVVSLEPHDRRQATELDELFKKYGCLVCSGPCGDSGGGSLVLARLTDPIEWALLRLCPTCLPEFAERLSAIRDALLNERLAELDKSKATNLAIFDFVDSRSPDQSGFRPIICGHCFDQLCIRTRELCTALAKERGTEPNLKYFPADRRGSEGASHDEQ
jgi:hypothetical protein